MSDCPLSCKELAEIWRIPPTKVTQARDPWELKTGALAAKRPREFALMVARAIARYEEAQEERWDADAARRRREEQAFRREVGNSS